MLSGLQQRIDNGIFGSIANFIASYFNINLSPSQAMLLVIVIAPVLLLSPVFFYFFRRAKVLPGKEAGTTGVFAAANVVLAGFEIPSELSAFLKYTPRWFAVITVLTAAVCFMTNVSYSTLYLMLAFLSSFAGVFVYVGNGAVEKKFRNGNYFHFGKYGFWRRVGLNRRDRTKGILVIGPTGSRKTAGLQLPNMIYDAKGNCSIVAVDRKSEENMADLAGPAWQAEGKKVVYFNPYDSDVAGFNLNPLLMIDNDFSNQETFDAIQETIDMLFATYSAKVGEVSADADWHTGGEERLLKCILMAVLKMPPGARNLPKLLEVVKMAPDELNRFIAMPGDKQIIDEYSFFAQMKDNDRINRLQGLYRKLQFLDNPTLKKALIRNDFDIDTIFKEPCLFIVKAELHRGDMACMASLLIRLIMRKHLHYTNPSNCKGFRKKTVWYDLDEFAQLNIPGVHNFATTIRSGDGGLVILAQSPDDLVQYMKKVKSGSSETAFQSSLRTMIILPGCHPDTCKALSEMMGEVSYKAHRKMKKLFGVFHSNYQEQAAKARLITADDIQFMKDDKAIVVSGTTRPFFVKTVLYFQDIRIVGLWKALDSKLHPDKHIEIGGKCDFYRVERKEGDFKEINLADLMRERASDIQEYLPEVEKSKAKPSVDNEKPEGPNPQADRMERVVTLIENKIEEATELAGSGKVV